VHVDNANGGEGEREGYDISASQYHAYSFDPEGNLQARSNGSSATQEVQDVDIYDAYGELLLDQTPGGTFPSPSDSVGFAGQWGGYTDKNVLLGTNTNIAGATLGHGTAINPVLMTHRYYDERGGRFINRDPIGYGGGMDLYAYADGNPVNNIDPDGTSSDGHHTVPQALWKYGQFSKDATTVFRRTRTGAVPEGHKWTKPHSDYNDAVNDLLNTFCTKRKIDPLKMTTAEAQGFVEYVKGSKNAAIKGYLDEFVASRFATVAVSQGDQAAVRVIFKLLKSPEAKAVLRKASKRAGELGLVVTLLMFASDVRAEGLVTTSGNALTDYADPFGILQFNKNPTDDPNWIAP
jgi:RHS repeat-associated protein